MTTTNELRRSIGEVIYAFPMPLEERESLANAVAIAAAEALQGVRQAEAKAQDVSAQLQRLREDLWDGVTGSFENGCFLYASSTEKTGQESDVPFQDIEVGTIRVTDRAQPHVPPVVLPVYRPLTASVIAELKLLEEHQKTWWREAEKLQLSVMEAMLYREEKYHEYINGNEILHYWYQRDAQRDNAVS